MNFWENIKVALESIRSNFLRSLLTLLIIAVGITCLVGILTAIDTILFSMSDSFNRLGANSFSIYPKNENFRSNNQGKAQKRAEPISFDQALKFKKKFSEAGALTSVNTYCGRSSEISFASKKTNPTVRLVGIDENYLSVSAYDIEEGRNFSINEVNNGSHKIIIGSDIVELLFNDKPSTALNQVIRVGSIKYKVVGTLASKGSSISNSSDRRVFIPLLNAKRYYGYEDRNYSVITSVQNTTQIDKTISSAIGVMRNVRKLNTIDENDFTIRKSDGILERLKEMTTQLRLATIAIALMTLFGAAIGLMNIMLVSVTERTSEIGLRKALGATSNNILIQFLTEAIVICILGGLVGILFGLIMGVTVAALIDGVFFVPVEWMTLGIVVCIVVGIVSGLYPALKASKLDPIESLRYE